MIRVEKIECDDFRDCRDLLDSYWRAGRQGRWQPIFDYRWQRDESHCGLVLKDGDQIVGFLGMVFSRRRINGKTEKFCNLTNWFVQERYRNRAISLLLPLFAMRDYTITDLSPSRTVYRIQQKLGFKDLDARGRILLPVGRRLFEPDPPHPRITHEPSQVREKLEGEHLRIFNDHVDYPCCHLLAADRERYCYLIYTRQKNRRMTYAHVHFISEPDFFALAYRDIRASILAESKAQFIMIESRLVRGLSLPLSFSLSFRAPKQYLSPRLQPEQIDNLYSEIILLNLRTHARLKYLLRDLRRRLLG